MGAVIVMRVLLFVLDVDMLREFEGDSNTGVGDGVWDVVAVSAAHDYVGGTRGSGILSSQADELGMRGVRGVGGA